MGTESQPPYGNDGRVGTVPTQAPRPRVLARYDTSAAAGLDTVRPLRQPVLSLNPVSFTEVLVRPEPFVAVQGQAIELRKLLGRTMLNGVA
jgi:hypothetical protein